MASSAAATEAQIKSEIERLTATINQHKATQNSKPWSNNYGYKPTNNYYAPYPKGRSNTYVNPGYKPANKYVRPGLNVAGPLRPVSSASTPAASASTSMTPVATPGPSSTVATPSAVPPFSSKQVSSIGNQKKEVVLGGVAFESSARTLVRKDLPKLSKPVAIGKPTPTSIRHQQKYIRKPGHVPPSRAFRLKVRPGRNMTLNNTRPYSSSRKSSNKRQKYIDKPCPRFTTTGTCSRGLTCMYQHDPAKIAICWPFLQGNCPNTAETCNLSHDPTPERTPLCVHFLNKGRCTREKCPYPHVNVGKREGVCRDFAVLGYCERGLECDRQHVRECPDFAEKGTCGTKGCKLPHVIRANQKRKAAAASASAPTSGSLSVVAGQIGGEKLGPAGSGVLGDVPVLMAEDGQLGDEFISLTFKESDSEEETDSEEEEEEDENENEEGSDESDSEMGDLEVNM